MPAHRGPGMAFSPNVPVAPLEVAVLADGFSCRTQLDQLADVKGTHLAALLASRLEADPANHRR